jgi:hypothetical protein
MNKWMGELKKWTEEELLTSTDLSFRNALVLCEISPTA